MTALFVRRGERLAARRVCGEMVILAADDSSLFVLNPTATLLWNAADGVTAVDVIVDREIVARFEVAPEIARQDAEEVIRSLASHGILLVSEQPMTEASRER